MKRLLALALFPLLLLATTANADHVDVIQITLKPGCTPAKWIKSVHDFNEYWGKDHGYKAEALIPLQSHDLASVTWVGRSANAAAFGAAWDAWRDALPDSKTTAAKLQVRFDECGTNTARRSYDVY